ncbi:MAG: hypothetical protein KIS96_00335 [Bauldia sp.]|nr:hypothetical protein [Bauldia sp.]
MGRRWPSGLAAAFGGALLAASAAVAQPGGALDQQRINDATHDEALRLLGEALGESVQATQTDPTIPSILRELEDNIDATRRIRELATAEDELTEEQMQRIAAEVTEIAESFAEIASYAPGVFSRRLGELQTLDQIGEIIGFRIADARARLEFLREDNQRIQSDLQNAELNSAQVEMRRLTQQANNAEIQSLDAAMQAWGFFADRHAELMTRMGDQSQSLEVFFHALRENARVYGAAAQTLRLANSLNLALSDLESIETLETMRSQLVQSWGDLMQIVNEVNDGLILQPGM